MSKRRQSASVQIADDRTPKRTKISQDASNGENVVTKLGLTLIKQVEQLKDRRGIHYADDFLTLPSRKDVPSYYQVIKTPIALDTIRTKLQQNKVKSLDDLEDMFKQMATNAKIFNEDGSTIVSDAERILKKVEEFMKKEKTNAAVTPKQSTPSQAGTGLKIKFKSSALRETSVSKDEAEAEVASGDDSKSTPAITLKLGGFKKASKSTKDESEPPASTVEETEKPPEESAVEEEEPEEEPPAGLSFNDAQAYVLSKVIGTKRHKDDTSSKFADFLFKPSRKLKDYYDAIKEPTSLKSIDKQIRGVQGREKEGSGISEFKTWTAFENAFAKVWLNAQTYNADGSEFYLLAEDLKTTFYKHFNKIKDLVPEPVPAARPAIKISLGTSKASSEERQGTPQHSIKRPTVSPAPSIEGGAEVKPNTDGTVATAATGSALDRARSASRPVSSPLATQAVISGSDINAVPSSNTNSTGNAIKEHISQDALLRQSMPPPSQTNGTSTAEAINDDGTVAVAAKPEATSTSTVTQQQPHTIRHAIPPAPIDVYQELLRKPWANRGPPLITFISLDVHPGLIVQNPLTARVLPNPTSRLTSYTLHITKGQNRLQIRPLISSYITTNNFQYRLYVTYAGIRLQPKGSLPGGPVDVSRPLFEIELWPGWANVFDLEMVAYVPKVQGEVKSGFRDEVEKVTLFLHYTQ